MYILFVLFSVLTPAHAEEYPKITKPVTDLGEILTDEEEQIIATRLVEHREKTGVQMAVLTVSSIGLVPIEDYSIRVAEKWGGGSADLDNGLLFVVAVENRQMRLEVGEGLEAVIPDGLAAVGIDKLPPYLQSKNYSGAVNVMIDFVIEETDHLTPDSPRKPLFHRRYMAMMIALAGASLLLVIGTRILIKRLQTHDGYYLVTWFVGLLTLMVLYGLKWGFAFGTLYTANFIFWACIAEIFFVKTPSRHIETSKMEQQKAPQATVNKEEQAREEILSLAKNNSRDTMVTCPICDAKVKAKNIVKHYDRVHSKARYNRPNTSIRAQENAKPKVKLSTLVFLTLWVVSLCISGPPSGIIRVTDDIWVVFAIYLMLGIFIGVGVILYEDNKKSSSGRRGSSSSSSSSSYGSSYSWSSSSASGWSADSSYESSDYSGGGGGFGGGGASGSW